MANQLELIENVDEQIIKIRTKSLDVSFNELYDMYSDGELVIKPDYQRLFRWNEEKQSRFIESLILEMPVPPIFVIEVDNGEYELIDGLQRISSYLHFRGANLDSIEKNDNTPLKLVGCDIVPTLNGLSFEILPKPLQIKLKRSFVRMEVIRKESEPSLKYHMFKRLNDGGESLSDQEIRNCTIRLLGSDAVNFISKCATDENFKQASSKMKESDINQKMDEEVILRFFALKNDLNSYRYPFSDFLTSFLENITVGKMQFNYEKEEKLFKDTFKIINETLGQDAFSNLLADDKYKNEFTLYYFDAISLSLSRYCDQISNKNYADIKSEFNLIKYGDDMKSYRTGSLSSIKSRIGLFEEGVKQALGIS